MVEGLKVATDKKAAAEQVKALYKLFAEKDCTMVEVGGWAGGRAGGVHPWGAQLQCALGLQQLKRKALGALLR